MSEAYELFRREILGASQVRIGITVNNYDHSVAAAIDLEKRLLECVPKGWIPMSNSEIHFVKTSPSHARHMVVSMTVSNDLPVSPEIAFSGFSIRGDLIEL